MTIYDRVKFKCRTFIESINLLFTMGSELEQEVDTAKDDITDLSDVTETGTTINNIVHKDGTETITGQKSMTNTNNDVRVKTTPDATTSAVNQAYVESTVDGVNNIAHKSGNESIAGIKTFTSPSSIIAKTTQSYNALYLSSRGVYNRLIMRKYDSDDTKFDPHMELGTTYATATLNSVRLKAYAPRTNIGDEEEYQFSCELLFDVANNGNCHVYLKAYKSDGTGVTKDLGTFNGTSWS